MVEILNVNMTDLATLNRKGVLRYVNSLYNPGGFFDRVHIISRNPEDFTLPLEPSIRLHRVPDWHNPALNLISGTSQMAKLVQNEGIDIIRGRGVFQPGLQAIGVGRRTKKSVVVSCGSDHQYVHHVTGKYEMRSPWLTDKTEEYVMRYADRIFVYDEFLKRYCISRGASEERIRIVPARTDLDFFNPAVDGRAIRAEYNLGADPVVLFVGIMSEAKQVDSVARVVPGVLLEEPRTKFVFVGGGWLADEIKASLQSYATNCLFVDYQPQERIAQFMAAATVVFIPFSVYVLLEAAATAKPIVAYNIEWHSEFVKDYVTGRIVPNRNEIEAAAAIVELIKDEKLARMLGQNARTKMEREFNEKDCIAREIAAYKELL